MKSSNSTPNIRKNHRLKRFCYIAYNCTHSTNDHLVVFESYSGKRFAGNPYAIYQEMLNDPQYSDFEFVWAFKNPNLHPAASTYPRTKVVKSGSRAYRRAYSEAKYWVNNVTVPDYIIARKDQVYIETWHGTPLKRLGCDIQVESDPRQSLSLMKSRYREKAAKIDFLVSPSRFYTEKISSAFDLKSVNREDVVIETGYPRNDILSTFTPEQALEIKTRLSVPVNKKVILYTPTWRDTQYSADGKFEYKEPVELGALQKKLGGDYIILFRAHHQLDPKQISELGEGVIDVTDVDDVNDLYLISDMLITDYSSTMFDYANLKRPMVFYMYDLEQYGNEIRGFYIDVNTLPGPIVQKESDLADAILDTISNFSYDQKYQDFNQTYNYLDDGNSSKRVLARCIPASANIQKSTFDKLKRTAKYVVLKISRQVIKLFGFAKKVYRKIRKEIPILFQTLLHIGRKRGLVRSSNMKKLYGYMNKYDGERCFIIGNGPSLKASDLDTLKNEYTFGSNMIYKIYDQTSWRPTFHCTIDKICAAYLSKEFKEHISSPLFTNRSVYNIMEEKPDDVIFVRDFAKGPYRVSKHFLSYYYPSGATVTSFVMELALFMGFKEIYLLGVDCTNVFGENGHFTNNYVSKNIIKEDITRIYAKITADEKNVESAAKYSIDKSLYAYSKLEEFSKTQNAKIYNATRGGNLEVFERIDFDSISKKES